MSWGFFFESPHFAPLCAGLLKVAPFGSERRHEKLEQVLERRIVVAVTNDIVTDQRVARTCDALVEDGHSVMLIGRLLPDSKPLSRPYRVCRMRLLFRRSALFYAEYNIRLFLRLVTAKAD